MSVFSDIYTMLNVTSINDLVDDISPYVRGRKKDFPAVLIEVPSTSFDRLSSGVYRRINEVELTCIARSVAEAEAVAEAVLTVLGSENCVALDSLSREYEEGYDEDSVGLFIVTIQLQLFSGA